jgi:protein TilB
MKSEHNNCEITTLEELSLHQQDIEKIEHLDRWCKDLKILYLQSNLISKIENVGRLKKLEYLNLALNNVTKIENLRGCERLQKLDLTINFVDDLLTIDSLIYNECLTEMYGRYLVLLFLLCLISLLPPFLFLHLFLHLCSSFIPSPLSSSYSLFLSPALSFSLRYLTGNPCTDYKGYREYVIATLPQLKWLDGKEISRSERITATQKLPQLRASIQEQQLEYQLKKKEEKEQEEEREKNKNKPGFNSCWYTDPNAHLTNETEVEKDNNEDDEDKFMNEPSLYTPESRVSLHKHLAEKRKDSTVQCVCMHYGPTSVCYV